MLELKGCIITIDTRGIQREIVCTIRREGTDYVLLEDIRKGGMDVMRNVNATRQHTSV